MTGSVWALGLGGGPQKNLSEYHKADLPHPIVHGRSEEMQK